MRKIEMAGRRFGRLVVLEEGEKRGKACRYHCQCDCGNKSLVSGMCLRRGHTKSCGCLNREMIPTRALKHGMTGTRVYWAWNNMKERCSDPSNDAWAHYGGRGITVCARWQSFDNFLVDMGEPPDGYSLDRIEVDGNYEPGNCRWATVIDQRRNMRSNRMVEWNGVVKCLSEWSEETGIRRGTLSSRLRKGWSVERAFTTPAGVAG